MGVDPVALPRIEGRPPLLKETPWWHRGWLLRDFPELGSLRRNERAMLLRAAFDAAFRWRLGAWTAAYGTVGAGLGTFAEREFRLVSPIGIFMGVALAAAALEVYRRRLVREVVARRLQELRLESRAIQPAPTVAGSRQ